MEELPPLRGYKYQIPTFQVTSDKQPLLDLKYIRKMLSNIRQNGQNGNIHAECKLAKSPLGIPRRITTREGLDTLLNHLESRNYELSITLTTYMAGEAPREAIYFEINSWRKRNTVNTLKGRSWGHRLPNELISTTTIAFYARRLNEKYAPE